MKINNLNLGDNSKRKKTVYLMAMFLGILMLSSIALTIASATKGAEINYLENQKHLARQEMEELTSSVVTSTSITQVSETANQLGLVKPDQVIYLNREVSVASLQR